MRYEFTVGRSCRVKTFLKEHDISKGLLAKIKFEGGHIWVNGEEQFATYPVHEGDVVAIEIPDEAPHETLKPIPFDLDIVYEDDNFLVINKPYGYASIPSVNHDNTMANFVKYHFVSNNYPNQRVHIVTRLDRDTSGLMLFAKHGYAHARMDKQLQQKSIKKHYYALVEGDTNLRSRVKSLHRLRVMWILLLHVGFINQGNMPIQAIAWLVIMVGLNWLISIFIPDVRIRFVCTLPT